MRSMKKLYLALLLLSQASCASERPAIAGDWMHFQTDSSSGALECPDMLSLKADGTYYVVNDCYGASREPIVEHGCWSLDSRERRITLRDRTFSTNYRFVAEHERLALDIVDVTRSEIIFQADGELEHYRRKERAEDGMSFILRSLVCQQAEKGPESEVSQRLRKGARVN